MSRIVTNSSAVTVYKNYNRANMSLAASAERLSTGLRINRASDDAAGLAISETLRAQVKGAGMAADNIANVNSLINTADGFLQNVSDILGRLEELAVEYGDPTKSSSDKSNLSAEFDALASKAATILDTAKFNGINLFSGTLSAVIVDANGTTESITGLSGASSFSAVSAATIGSVTAVQSAINTLSTMRGNLGASQSKLNFTLIGVENYVENVSAAESRIRNVDVAKETTSFSRYQIQVQASTAMLAQANSLPQNVLSLIRG
ncbi:MAG: flagellin [Planctomycetota bacterium]|nr:flagellin [Planctomycetota bacterium]